MAGTKAVLVWTLCLCVAVSLCGLNRQRGGFLSAFGDESAVDIGTGADVGRSKSIGDHPFIDINDTQRKQRPRYAIAYLIAGCDELSCMGYVLNILVAKAILDYSSFGGDVMVMIRMDSTYYQNSTTGANDQVRLRQEPWLVRAQVQVHYLPILPQDNFVLAQLDKFRILNFLQYERILYLDSDAIPLCNLDYIFEASLNQQLSDYVAMAQFASPTTGSIFLFRPKEGAFSELMTIIRQTVTNRTHFDIVNGFGHVMSSPHDYWTTLKLHDWGQNYTFYGAGADQGLLYHWLKYVQKNWTLLFREAAHTWRQVDNNSNNNNSNDTQYQNAIELEDGSFIAMVKTETIQLNECHSPRYARAPWARFHLYADHYHFGGVNKPWLVQKNQQQQQYNLSTKTATMALDNITDPHQLWWAWLGRAALKWNLDIPQPLILEKPKLGLFPKENSLYEPDVVIPK